MPPGRSGGASSQNRTRHGIIPAPFSVTSVPIAMSFVLYGIKNCDTVKKARQWLVQHRVEFSFHDFRSDGFDSHRAQAWLDEVGADTLINRRGTTFRQLDEAQRMQLEGPCAAEILAATPTLIKRPVLDLGHQRVVGFSDTLYRELFKTHTL